MDLGPRGGQADLRPYSFTLSTKEKRSHRGCVKRNAGTGRTEPMWVLSLSQKPTLTFPS